jgi:hypothetical protein
MNILKEYLVPSICGRTYLYGNHADASVSSRIVAALTMQIDPAVLVASLEEAVTRFPHFGVGLQSDGDKFLFREIQAEVPVFEADEDQPFCFDDSALNGYLFKVSYAHKTLYVDFHRAMADEAGMMTFVKSVLFNYLERSGYPVTTGGAIKLLSSEYFKAEGEDAMPRIDDAQSSRPVWYMDAKAVVPASCNEPLEEVVHIRVPVSKLRKEYSDIVNIPVTYIAPLFSHAVHEMYGGEIEAGEYVVASVQVNLRPYYPSATMRPYHTPVYLAYNRNLSDYPYSTVLMSQKKLLEAQLKPDTLAYSAQRKISDVEKSYEGAEGELDERFSRMQEDIRAKSTYDIAGLGHVILPESMQRLVTELYPVIPSPGRTFSVTAELFKNELAVTVSGRRNTGVAAARLVELLQGNDIDAYIADCYSFKPMSGK